MTYTQAYNKIIDAYFKDEIKPYDAEFCFCGTLGYKTATFQRWDINLYSMPEYLKMEYALLTTIKSETMGKDYAVGDIYVLFPFSRKDITNHPNYENALFNGMCAALDVLKKIYISRSEIVDEPKTQFKKRELFQT